MSTVSFPRRLLSASWWTWWKAAIAAALLLGISFVAFGPRGAQVQYQTATIARGTLTVAVSSTGTLKPDNQVDVGTEISGRVDEVLVDNNDQVKKGQLLAVINTDTVQAQLAQYRASLAQARAALATARATQAQQQARRDRYRNLQATGAASTQDTQTAEADYERARASISDAEGRIESAEAQISNSRTQIEKAQVRSPIDGVVLSRAISVGQTVAASFNTPVLFTLASDLSRMQLSVDIDEADIGTVREGQKATFTVDAFPNQRFSAQLVSLYNSPKTQNGVVTFPGALLVDNRALVLRPGLTATADILVERLNDVVLVPNAALRFTPPASAVPSPPPPPKAPDGQQAGRVWVLVGGKPEPRDLVLGRSDGVFTRLISGKLAVGDTIATDLQSPVHRAANP